MRLLHELKRRNAIRVAGPYLSGAWLLVQVAGMVLPWFNVPPAIPRGLVVALALGFVPALAFARLFGRGAHGISLPAVESGR